MRTKENVKSMNLYKRYKLENDDMKHLIKTVTEINDSITVIYNSNLKILNLNNKINRNTLVKFKNKMKFDILFYSFLLYILYMGKINNLLFLLITIYNMYNYRKITKMQIHENYEPSDLKCDEINLVKRKYNLF